MPIVMVDGPDRLGKSSLCQELCHELDYMSMHFSRPEGKTSSERAYYQMGTFDRMFRFVGAIGDQMSGSRIVFDRSHLGEMVYGPLYRGDSGVDPSYVYDMETMYTHGRAPYYTLLVLLKTTDFETIRSRDDGLSFDISRLEEETELFSEAFERSNLRKVTIDVTGKDLDMVKAEFMDQVYRHLYI